MSAVRFVLTHADSEGHVRPNWLTRAATADGVREKAISLLQCERQLDAGNAARVVDLLIEDGTFLIVSIPSDVPHEIRGLGV